LVQRCGDDSDERVSRVFLTGAGCDIRPAVEEVWCTLDRQILAGFSDQELAQFADFLTRVCNNIEES
jgi:DNA-binding MarR family transcriptional regulator